YAPFTRKPVMLMEARLFANILPQELFKMMQADRQLVGLADLELPDTWLARLSIIPYRGAGQSMEMMVTLKPDEVVISTPENEWITERVLIGLEHHSLD